MANFDNESLANLCLLEQLSTRGLSTSGLKDEFVNRLQESLQNEQERKLEEGKISDLS